MPATRGSSTGSRPTARRPVEGTDLTARQRRRMEELLAEHTGRSVERIRADLERDFILDAERAKAYGVVDEVVEPRRLASVAALERR